MESNINFTEISKYSKVFSETACARFYESRNSISGEEILNLTPVKQVNLFVIYELLNLWKEENSKLRSPYFDYESKEVQEALARFMNTLSKNIQIKSEDLKPLLQNATEKALLLIFSPYQFYKNEIDTTDRTRLKLSQLKDLKKYIKVNHHLLDKYVETLESENIEEIFNDDAIKMFDEVCENINESPDDFDPYIPQFGEVTPLDINLIYKGLEEPKAEKAAAAPYEEEEEEEDEYATNNLNTSLHKDVETLADIHERRHIDGIKKNITINQRFMFVNELFSGNADEFESVVTYLDNCERKADAINFLQSNCVEARNWDTEAEEVQEFMGIVNKRFSE